MMVNGTAQQNENALDILLPTNLVEIEHLVNNYFSCQIPNIFYIYM